jgi:hypothetical protein
MVLAGLLTRFHFANLPTLLANKGSGIAEQNVERNSQLRAQSPIFTRFPFRLFSAACQKRTNSATKVSIILGYIYNVVLSKLSFPKLRLYFCLNYLNSFS